MVLGHLALSISQWQLVSELLFTHYSTEEVKPISTSCELIVI